MEKNMTRVFGLLILLMFVSRVTGYAQENEWDTLNHEVKSLYNQGRYDSAVVLAKKALQVAEQTVGPNHPDVVTSLYNLAELYETQGQYAKAESLYERALAIDEKTYGPDDTDVAMDLYKLGALYRSQGQYAEAEPFFGVSLTILENTHGPDHPDVAKGLNNLAELYYLLGQYVEAEPLYRRSLEINEKIFGPDNPTVATSLNNLAVLFRVQGRYAEAEQLYKRSLAITEALLNYPSVAICLNNLADLFHIQGKYVEAEPLYRRSLEINEKTFGPDNPTVATSLNNLAVLFRVQGRYAEAEQLYKRSLAITEKDHRPDHLAVAQSLNNLALLYQVQSRYAEAEPLYRRSLEIKEKALGSEHPDVAQSMNNLAGVYLAQGRFVEAELLCRRSLLIREKALGLNHPDVAKSLNNLAWLYYNRDQFSQAEPLYRRSLEIREHVLGPDHPDIATSLYNMAELYRKTGRSAEAVRYSRRTVNLLRHRFESDTGTAFATLAEQKTRRSFFTLHLSLLEHIRNAAAVVESFEAYQLAQASSVGQSVAQMAARFAAQGGELAGPIRELQDSVDRLTRADKTLIEAIGQPPEKIDSDRVTRLRKELADLEQKTIEQRKAIASRFPDYDALVSPAPVPAVETQKLLRDGEALVTYLTDETEGCFAWLVLQDRTEFRRLDVTAKEVETYVARLRARLDPEQNPGQYQFDVKTAHVLYQKVFEPLEKSLAGVHHVIIVPDGSLQGLPFPVLVDKMSTSTDQTSWLTDRYAFSTVPSVSALRALRTFSRRAPGDLPFAGFGNPVLGGETGKKLKLEARSLFTQVDTSGIGRTRSGIANVKAIRNAQPLPETATELQAIADSLKAPASALYMQGKATETIVKQLDLTRQRVLAFSTHGVMAGELTDVAEPGLILTPPEQGTLLDDGYLSASEVAQLKLNADWVLLSACNTASSDGTPGAEGLSGLAKAFFYAGARSLLVSNWYVVSNATVRITTEMLKIYAENPTSGKAEALRMSMRKLRSDPKFSHPLFWAPFVVVGEGGAAADVRK